MIVLAAAYLLNKPSNEEKQIENADTDIQPETAPAFKQIIEPDPPKEYIGELELPIDGATGYASIEMDLKSSADDQSDTIEILEAGTGFVILEEVDDWWLIETNGKSGWVKHQFCLINLPDVIPSIIYNNTNTYSSKFVSSGKSLPGITGQALYKGKTYNERLDKEEYIVPVLYAMSKKIFLAQQFALEDDNTLVIYEGYRPYSIQQAVVKALSTLAHADQKVMAGINSYPWSTFWFIDTKVSNHQIGYAIDVSLAKIDSKTESTIGDYLIKEITKYTEYKMPTPIHELSMASATFTAPVSAKSPTDWKKAILDPDMNKPALLLQMYCTDAGLTPLASEWWHFNDLDALNSVTGNSSDGSYILSEVHSVIPL
ncbi:hypothetical protein [Lysinibacillus yapensis]|uniref:hypothetical protein n=1 Tax=Ureibacillus yapensis TaxID=2304605 RepID=UPI001314122C|nr:hypothetical protein [Lysinibacillus yapensis]